MKKEFSKQLVNEFPDIFTVKTEFSYDPEEDTMKCLTGVVDFNIYYGSISMEIISSEKGFEFMEKFHAKDFKKLSDWVEDNWNTYNDDSIISVSTDVWYIRTNFDE